MRKFFILLCIPIVGSCFNGKTKSDATVNFEKIEVKKQGNKLRPDSAYDVSIAYYNPVDAPVYLQDSILKYTKLLLASWFDLKGQFNPDVSVKKHFDGYCKQIAENNLPGYIAFILKISPDDIYQNEHIISFEYSWMIYEGGAHPNSGKFCFVINKNTGSKVSYNSLTKGNETEFLNIAETEFRTQSGIKANENIYNLYWFKDSKFHLTDNYRFTPEGLVFCYNPYEIAPYSFGLIEFTIPYSKIEKLIKWE
jgi:hypothetical protein